MAKGKKFSAYRSIDNFKNFISGFKRHFRYEGKDENGDPIYNPDIPLPIVEVRGTEKIHGTNAGIGYNMNTEEIWFQSRNNIITPDNDNQGFAAWATGKMLFWKRVFCFLVESLADDNDVKAVDPNQIFIYGEWAGGNIFPNKSACSGHDKCFILFDFKVRNSETDEEFYCQTPVRYIPELPEAPKDIFSIDQHEFKEKELDTNHPEPFLREVEQEILKLEEESVFGKYVMKIDGNTGEGYVYRFRYKEQEFIFKIKGGKHAERKTKIPKMQLTPEEMESRKGMAFQVTPEWRLSQMFDEVFQGEPATMRKTGEFIKAVMKDIIKEESNVIADAGYTMKDLNMYIVGYIKHYLNERIREEMNS